MNFPDVIENLKNYVAFEKEELQEFFNFARYKRFKKNEILVKKGEEVSPFIFIRKGCLMTYFTDDKGFHHVLQFGLDKWWTGDLDSFVTGNLSAYTIKAMTDTEVLIFDKESFETLCAKSPDFEKYFRMLFQNSLVSHQKRIIRNISYTAEEKYLTFVKNYPKLELLLPQKYIASYLGITPEFLSMLKKKLAKKA